MSLTRDGWEKLILLIIGAILGAVLAVLGNLFILQWNKADVRYGTAGTYIHSKLAIAIVGLKNWGASDAENVTITASFADPFTNVSTDQVATPFEPSGGGTDKKSVTGTIKRLASGEVVNIYFITEPSSPWVDQKPVIRGVKFNGGLGKTGVPILMGWVLPWLAAAAVCAVIGVPLFYWGQHQKYRHYDQLREAIRMGLSAAQEGLPNEQLKARLEEWYRNIPFFRRRLKEELMVVADAAFTGAPQSQMTP
jgi:ABC-type multidrug transport system fused ATPase/permease subunit